MGPADAERRIAAQVGLRARARSLAGTVVVDASGDEGQTEELVAVAFAAALARAGAGGEPSR
jgi:hypothetical protein